MFDTVIKGGTVVDGSGEPRLTADIAIKDGVIAEVGRVTGPARETVAADGLLVTPGWVDIHTHYDGQATWDSQLAPSFWHGVTTVVMGNCGVGFAPASPDKHDWLIGLMEGVEDIPGSALAEGIKWEWESFPEYLDALARKPHALNIGAQITHGAVRAYVMGERGARNEAATADDIAAMARIVREAQDSGSFGFSTSRTMVHRAVDGEPVPGTFAAVDELQAIAQAIAASGHGVLEVAPAGITGDDLIAPPKEIAWMRQVSAATGVPITFLLAQNMVDPEHWRAQLAECRQNGAAGARVVPQVFGRSTGVVATLATRMHPFRSSPTFKSLAKLPYAEMIARLKADPALRLKVAQEGMGAPDDRTDDPHRALFRAPWPNMYRMGHPVDYEPDPSQSIARIAERDGRDPRAVALDILLEDDGQGMILQHVLGYADGNLDAEYAMLTDPQTVLGGSDGGAHVSVICDAGVPTFMLTHWVRDRSRGPRLPLEQIVRKQTHDTARLYGVRDRGLLRPGMRADVNLIDFDRLGFDRPRIVGDLPTGANRLMQRARGYVATYVSGTAIQREGEDTGARPGTLLRSHAG